jgi:hypothetical protein
MEEFLPILLGILAGLIHRLFDEISFLKKEIEKINNK